MSRVLLVEAGGTMPWIGSVPGLVALLQKTPVDWAYKTEVCRHCSCLKPLNAVIQESSVYYYLNIFQPSKVASLGTGGVSLWPRGKLLGGSSILNYMLYVRGNSRQVDYTNQSINSVVKLDTEMTQLQGL